MNIKVFNNAVWMIIGGITEALIGFVISIFTVRYLGPSNYGLIGYAVSLTSILKPFITLGFNNVIVNEIVNKPDKEGETMGTVIGFSLFSALASYVGMLLFCYFTNPGETITLVVCALYGTMMMIDAVKLLDYWFQAKLLSKYVSITSSIVYFLIAFYKVFLLVTGKNVYWFAISNSLDYGLLCIALVLFYKKNSTQKLSFNFKRGIEILNVSKYYIISVAMTTLLSNVDRVMIKGMISDEANGYYSAAMTISTMTYFVFVAIFNSFRPQILEYKNHNDEERYNNSIIDLYNLTFYLALFQALFLTLFSRFIVNTLYGNQYAGSISILCVLGFATIFNYFGTIFGIWILAENKYKQLPIINGVTVVLNIVLNYVFIIKCGVIGAAYATLLTYVFINFFASFIYSPIKGNKDLLLKSLNLGLFIKNLNTLKRTFFKTNE